MTRILHPLKSHKWDILLERKTHMEYLFCMENSKSPTLNPHPPQAPNYLYCVPIFPVKKTGVVVGRIFGIIGLIGILLGVIYLFAAFFHDSSDDIFYIFLVLIFGGSGLWFLKMGNKIITAYRVCPVCNAWIDADSFKSTCEKCGAEEGKPFVPKTNDPAS